MKRLLCVLGIAAFCSNSLLGQAPAPRPAFDITGIQVSTRPQPGMRGGVLRGTRYEVRHASMVDLIRTAYNVQPERITGGPGWLEWNRFDIAALAPENTPGARARDAQNAACGALQAGRSRGYGDNDSHGAASQGRSQTA